MIRGRNGLNFLLFLHFVPALHPQRLLFNSSGFGLFFQALLGLWKAQLLPNVTNFLLSWSCIITDVKNVPELPAEIRPAAQEVLSG